jgi:hypothetical protein
MRVRAIVMGAKAVQESLRTGCRDAKDRFAPYGRLVTSSLAAIFPPASGVQLDVIHTLAGHTRLQTTMERYNQPTDQRKVDAANTVGNWLAANGSSTG